MQKIKKTVWICLAVFFSLLFVIGGVAAPDLWSRIYVDKTFHGGNTSYAGYAREMTLDDGIEYDLAADGFEGLLFTGQR